MTSDGNRLAIAFGSETGNARRLAERLGLDPAFAPFEPSITPLGEFDLAAFDHRHRLVIISSSFGDGEPPANAEGFLERLKDLPQPQRLRYAIFGIGDVAYPHFCGFTKGLDAALRDAGAVPFANRVDADTDFDGFFEIWRSALLSALKGDEAAALSLALQVKSYGENNTFDAPIIERQTLNGTAPFAWHYRFGIEGSGINYRAGDNLYLVPENDPELLSQLAEWFGEPGAFELFSAKELRSIGKSFLRQLARLTENNALKELLKIANKIALEDYLYGRDLLDILQDFATPGAVAAAEVASHLPAIQPRAYSIASHGNPDYIDLCIRNVSYELQGRRRAGAATGYLDRTTGTVPIFVRANPRFHLSSASDHPLILVGTGTGIGPFMGMLEQAGRSARSAHTCLVFGDRRSSSDFLYEDRIRNWERSDVVGSLITAFSRDGAEPYYVQHALMENADHIWQLLDQGAHVYVCGNKANLDRSIDDVIRNIAARAGGLPEDRAEHFVHELVLNERLHKELY
ncbi:sulfite reductase flavoprotein subunit alpha [Mycoplana sp. MJR14]|uniref:diflavin oxidoreductase n=1 Tax=Mycoplana sp. MJR14 TaxID=3032583 RepID=UPI0023D9D6C3|nr:sulfite reductase flavoprotein subunit alpha [Mycoplana sp. MJR14]MDF1631797.1 sulfite reductase flavoprotein subunit alpha [Mycoplana sp. MJR14]